MFVHKSKYMFSHTSWRVSHVSSGVDIRQENVLVACARCDFFVIQIYSDTSYFIWVPRSPVLGHRCKTVEVAVIEVCDTRDMHIINIIVIVIILICHMCCTPTLRYV